VGGEVAGRRRQRARPMPIRSLSRRRGKFSHWGRGVVYNDLGQEGEVIRQVEVEVT
jgi:hypothetical protein